MTNRRINNGYILALLAAFSLQLGCRFVSGDSPKKAQRPSSVASLSSAGDDWSRGLLPSAQLEGNPRDGGEVAIQIGTEPPSLNTLVDSDWYASHITEHRIYESLLSVDPYDHPRYAHRPGLAERWDVSPEGLVYTFHLRHGVRWHDGRPFSSKDVLATFAKIRDPKTKAAHVRSYTSELSGVEALDDYTVRFSLSRPYFLVMDGVFSDVPIQPAHVLDTLSGTAYNEAATNPLNRHPIGTGPFRFQSWESNQRIVLERNSDYWGSRPHLERLVFRIVKDANVALELAARGELDVVSRIRTEQWVKMDSRYGQGFNRSLFFDANYSWIGWNRARPQFADARVRRALTLLIDRPGILSALQHGLARPTTCHFYWASEACDPALVPLPYDPLKAVALLSEAGWVDRDGDGVREKDGVVLRFHFLLPAGSEEAARMATLIKEGFARAGIEMQIQRMEWSSFVRRLREREFDACTLGWAGGGPRSDPTQVWHSASIAGGSNYIGFSSPRVDQLLKTARGELDDGKRNQLFREFGKILYDDQPYTWLFVRPRMALVSKRIFGVRTTLSDWQYQDWWVVAPRKSQGG